MVGSGTVRCDDPQLTTRLEAGGRDPVRIILDGGLSTSPQAVVYTQSSDAQTLLVTSDSHSEETLQPYRSLGVEIIQIRRMSDGLDLRVVLAELNRRDIHTLLLEGGSELAGAMLRAGLVDRLMLFVAPKLLGGAGRDLFSGKGAATISDACSLTDLRSRQIDTDILIEGEVQYVHRPD
jgi:diaminohydroxyphosphoribosylaminopyrimidine deaminase/5-amino-6-(5-phosphoribosylamino)uracil reductase